MIAMIKRILNLAGKHKSKILLGILFNFLKSVCMAMVLWAVYIVASDLDSLTMDVIWNGIMEKKRIVIFSELPVRSMKQTAGSDWKKEFFPGMDLQY